MHCLLAGRTAIGERVWDITCLIDWVVSDLVGADAERIGMLGNSGGGVLTVYVAALDERIAVAHPSCSLTSFASESGYIFHCDCCMVPGIKTELADMPAKYIHAPWLAPKEILSAANVELGDNYPMPIVDVKQSRELALEEFKRIKIPA